MFGAGAVGLGLGSALIAAGHRVRFVAREATVTALCQQGLIRSGLFGEALHPPDAFEAGVDAGDFSGPRSDFVLVCTKSFASAEAAAALARAKGSLSTDAPVILCQNGWGNAEHFAPAFGPKRVFCSSVLTGFRRLAANHADITVHAAPIRMGSLSGVPGVRIRALCQAISQGGIPCEPSDDMAAELWAKILYNGCLNPLGALLGEPYGALAENLESRASMSAIAHEIFAVMDTAGIRTHWATADEWLAHFYEVLIPPTRSHESSMLQDLRAGLPTEIESLTGAVVRLADTHGIAVPTNRSLLERVRAAESAR